MMKNIFALFILTLTGVSAGWCQYKLPAGEQIPVLAWGGVRPEETSVARYAELKAAGFNISLTKFSDAGSMQKAMDSAHKAGVQLIVRCPELESETEKTVKRFMRHPAIAGYYLKDEPGRSLFPSLGDQVKKIRAIDDKHFCYLNLLPNVATPALLGAETYKEYLDAFIKEVPVQLLSFDHYPITENTKTRQRSYSKQWYENLELFADASSRTGKPFWAFAMSVAHGLYPVPTVAELKLQVYSNLAYGAKGIAYFTYWTPLIRNDFNYRHGVITHDTKQRTEVYDRIQAVNNEIQQLAPVFMKSKLVSVSHTGEHIPAGTKAFSQNLLPDIITNLKTEGEGAVVSLLKSEKNHFLVVVNRDFKNPMKLTIEGKASLKKILKNGTVVPAATYIPSMEIDPGDAAIYMW